MFYDVRRDAGHKRRVPCAFDHGAELSIQSSLYLTNNDRLDCDSLAVCLGSHLVADDPGWRVDPASHMVTVPARWCAGKAVKVATGGSSRLVLYNSTMESQTGRRKSFLCRFGEKRPLLMTPLQLDELWILMAFVFLCSVATIAETAQMREHLTEDANAIFRPSQPFTSWSKVDTVGSGKGGSAITPLTLSRWAWEARLLPKRVDLFRRLLGEDDICVGLDSVHWDPKGGRLCSMASFTYTSASGLVRNNYRVYLIEYRRAEPQRDIRNVAIQQDGKRSTVPWQHLRLNA